jgi:LacI family transcriptional regulator
MKGYLEALKRNKINFDNSLIVNCTEGDQQITEAIRKLLKKKNRPDGIFASVEKLALITYEICNELNLKIPHDVKVICFSNSQTAALLNPSLTTITQPAYEIGREAASILFRLVEKKRHHFLIEQTILNSQLIERDSTKATSKS